MNLHFPSSPRCAVALAVATALAGCSSVEGFLAGDKVDYRGAVVKAKPLEVPPDLSQLARDSRYAPQGGVVSAAAAGTTPALPAAGSAPLASVAPNAVGKVRVEKQGPHKWLVAEAPPEVVYPEVRAFWQERGVALTTDKPDAGLIETDWMENRAKLPNDLIRSTIGRFFDRLYDTGERDRFRVRVERGQSGTEIYLSHRGMEEVFVDERKESTAWRPRNSDPALEAEILTRLLMKLGNVKEDAAKSAVATAPEQPARARALAEAATMEVDEPFDRAWRRVGLALDRSGFSVEDRDRSAGLYFVRYVDPKAASAEEPGFFSRLFGAKGPDKTPVRYRVALKANGAKTTVSVQGSAGGTANEDAGRNIVAQLVRELR